MRQRLGSSKTLGIVVAVAALGACGGGTPMEPSADLSTAPGAASDRDLGASAADAAGSSSEPDLAVASVCGNNLVEPGETCDGASLNGQTCTTVWGGFQSGVLGCKPDCSGYVVTACVPGNALLAASCAQTDVQAKVNQAVDGDTVLVPAGTCTWNTALTITNKTITLKGAGSGAGGTHIIYGGSNHTLIDVEAGTHTGTMDISGFWLQGGDPEYWNGTAMQLYGPDGWRNLRVHDNVFDGNSQWTIKGSSAANGLIDHNTFKGSAGGIMLYGKGASDWAAPLVLGSADFFFVEDNTFSMNDDYGNTKHPIMDMDNGGRQVFRHNTISNGLWETHDKARSGLPSANAYEIYGNSFTASTTQWKGLDVSAGTGVIYGNTFTGDFSVAIGAMDYKSFDPRSVKLCDGTDPADQNVSGEHGWRCQYQIGSMGEGATAYGYPLYLWSNTHNGSNAAMQCTDGCDHVQAARDYINNGAAAKPGYVAYPYPHPHAQ